MSSERARALAGMIGRDWPSVWQVELRGNRLELSGDRLRVVREGDGAEVFVARIEADDLDTVVRYLEAVRCGGSFEQEASATADWMERNRASIGLMVACAILAVVLAIVVVILIVGMRTIAIVVANALFMLALPAFMIGWIWLVKIMTSARRPPRSVWWY